MLLLIRQILWIQCFYAYSYLKMQIIQMKILQLLKYKLHDYSDPINKSNKNNYIYIYIHKARMRLMEKRIPAKGMLTDNCYKHETQSYRLLVSYNSGILSINLYDFRSWQLYAKEYSDDNDRQIHKKVDLEDLYYSLTLATHDKDHGQDPASQRYKFGQIIMRNGVPYYSVNGEGKLTVYVTMTDQRLNKKVEYISNLVLAKVRDLTQLQKITEKANQERRQLLKQITKLKTQNKQLAMELQRKIPLLKLAFTFTKTHQHYQYIPFPYQIPHSKHPPLKFQIIETIKRINIGIGVMDLTKCQDSSLELHQNKNIVGYYCWAKGRGIKYPSEQEEGRGYAKGDVVEVRVELEKGYVEWFVGGELFARERSEILKDKSRVFVPFVQAFFQGTVVKWVP